MQLNLKLFNKSSPHFFDFILSILLIFMIYFGWYCFLGWSPDSAMTNHDGLAMGMPFLQDLYFHKGDWTQMLFRAEVQGGANLYQVAGIYPILILWTRLGATPVQAFNALIVLLQFCFAFLGIRATLDFAEYLKPNLKKNWLNLLFLSFIFAFAPVIGWRLTRGHEIIVGGSLIFLCAFSWILAIRAETVSWILMLVTVLTVTHVFSVPGQQTVVYSLVFGSPILLGLLWDIAGQIDKKQWLLHKKKLLLATSFCLLVLGSIGLVLPHFINLYQHAMGPDSPRSIKGAISTYEYVSGQWQDWLASIPWTLKSIVWTQREEILWHEINYAFGPPLLLLFLFPWRKFRSFSSGLVISILGILAFSMNIKPISTALITLIPPLQLFRVPQRSILPVCYTVLIVGSAALLAFESRQTDTSSGAKRRDIIAFVFSTVVLFSLFWTPALMREILIWSLIAGLGIFILPKTSKPTLFLSLILSVFALGSILSTKERKYDSIQENELFSRPQLVRSQILAQTPELSSPLNRAYFNINYIPFDINSGYGMAISSLDGYWFPNRRYLQLITALENTPYTSSLHYLVVSKFTNSAPILRQLYNVQFDVNIAQDGIKVARSPFQTAGQAWFSAEIKRLKNFQELSKQFISMGSSLGSQLKKTTWIPEEDPLANQRAPSDLSPLCAQAKVLEIESAHLMQTFKFKVNTPADCLMNVALTFSTYLEARTELQGKVQKLTTLPANGSLLGIWVPAGTQDVIVAAKIDQSLWKSISVGIGFILIAVAGFLKFLL